MPISSSALAYRRAMLPAITGILLGRASSERLGSRCSPRRLSRRPPGLGARFDVGHVLLGHLALVVGGDVLLERILRGGDGGFDDATAQLATGALDLGGDLPLGLFLETLAVGLGGGHDARLPRLG